MLVISLTHQKILAWSVLKESADNKIKVVKKKKFGLDWLQNIVGNEENAGNQHFLLFPQCFQKLSVTGSLQLGIVW